MASIYIGLSESELLEMRSNFLKVLQGKRLASTSGSGQSASRFNVTPEQAERQIRLIQQALYQLDPDTYPQPGVTLTYMRAT